MGCGVKLLPGDDLAQENRHGINPGRDSTRVALMHDAATVRQAPERVIQVFVQPLALVWRIGATIRPPCFQPLSRLGSKGGS